MPPQLTRPLPEHVQVRAANTEEMEDFRFVANIALAEHGVPERDPVNWLQPQWTTCVFERGALVTTFAAWPFSMRFNGQRAAVAGVTAVGTLPTKRRRGYLRAAMETALHEQYERGQSLAALYASQAAIYQRYGYAICSERRRYEIDPLDLAFAHAPTPTGDLTVLNAKDLPDDAQTIRDLYRAFAEPRNGLLHRGKDLWNAELLAEPDDHKEGPVRCLLYEEHGQPLGYTLYTAREDHALLDLAAGQRDHRINVRELAWLSPHAYVAMWQYLAAHDLAVRIHVQDVAADDPLFTLARDPRTLRTRSSDGILLRIVDLPRALPIRNYDTEASITFHITDQLCPWNRGTWTLDAGPDGADIRQTDHSPQLSMDIHALAQLVSGYRSATYLQRIGRIDAHDPNAQQTLTTADHLFATQYAMHCMNHF